MEKNRFPFPLKNSGGQPSNQFRDVFGDDKMSVRLVYGVASLPLGLPVELEVIFEVE
jgi:hypothetical protein